MANWLRLIKLLLLATAGLVGSAASAQSVTWAMGVYERFDDVLRDPNLIYHEETTATSDLTRFIVDGESADDWTEAFEVISTPRQYAPQNARDWYDRFREQGERTCPGQWEIVTEARRSLTFERRTEDCPGFAAQHALYRVMYGRIVYVLIATRKGAMDAETRAGWLRVLESAER